MDKLRHTDAVDTTTRTRRWVVAAVLIATLAVAGGAYAVLGWQRMEASCPSGADYHHTWEWSPVGLTCAAEDGTTKSSLWWSQPFHLAE